MGFQFGLIGYPLQHSRSPEWYTRAFARAERRDCRYDLFPLAGIGELPRLLEQHPSMAGLNVTIPWKEKVMAYLDHLDPVAGAIGAVNTILIGKKNGKEWLQGYNTDAEGFLRSADFSPYSRALILGTGGAAKAIAYALTQSGKQVTMVTRQGTGPGVLTYPDLTEPVIRDHLLIINATPVGMAPHSTSSPAIPYRFLTSGHFLYDTIYAPEETLFLQQGKQQGTKTQSGLRMLFTQAELSFTLFLQALHS